MMFTFSDEFLEAGKNFSKEINSGILRESRQMARKCLGLPNDRILFMAGGQPLFLGGPPKILGKLILLKHLKNLDHEVSTIYKILANDVPRSDREFYKTFLPSTNGDIWLGLSRKRLPSDVKASAIPIQPLDNQILLKTLESNYRIDKIPKFLVSFLHNYTAKSLAYFNFAWLRRVAALLDIEPDFWIVDNVEETAIIGTDFWTILTRKWNDFKSVCNHINRGEIRLFNKEDAPIWLYDSSRYRRCLFLRNNYLVDNDFIVSCEELPGEILRLDLSICFRALPRIVAQSVLYDGHISGTGSHYNRVVEKGAEICGLPIAPRIPVGDRVFQYGASNDSLATYATTGRAANKYGIVDLLTQHKVVDLSSRIRCALHHKIVCDSFSLNLNVT